MDSSRTLNCREGRKRNLAGAVEEKVGYRHQIQMILSTAYVSHAHEISLKEDKIRELEEDLQMVKEDMKKIRETEEALRLELGQVKRQSDTLTEEKVKAETALMSCKVKSSALSENRVYSLLGTSICTVCCSPGAWMGNGAWAAQIWEIKEIIGRHNRGCFRRKDLGARFWLPFMLERLFLGELTFVALPTYDAVYFFM